MDIKEIIGKVTGIVSKNPDILEKFKKNPAEALKSLKDIDLPADQIKDIISGVTNNLKVGGLIDSIESKLGIDIPDNIENMFKK